MSEYFNDEFPQGLGKRRPLKDKQPKKKYSQKKIGLIVVGNAGVGKTNYIEALQGEEFYSFYDPTFAIEKTIYEFVTEKGGLEGVFRVFDVGGNEKNNSEMSWPKRSRVDCAILMFDLTSTQSYKDIPEWYEKIKEKYPGILMVLCGNKADARERLVRPKFIRIHKKYDIPYYDVSAKNFLNIEKPFMFFVNRIREKTENIKDKP